MRRIICGALKSLLNKSLHGSIITALREQDAKEIVRLGGIHSVGQWRKILILSVIYKTC